MANAHELSSSYIPAGVWREVSVSKRDSNASKDNIKADKKEAPGSNTFGAHARG